MVSFALEPSQPDDDRHSTSTAASTVATTTSLASRIASLALDFGDKLKDNEDGSKDSRVRKPDGSRASEPLDEQDEEQDDEEELVEITEEEMLQMLDIQEPPLQVCSRLFAKRKNNPIPLKRLTMTQIEEFRQHGYVVVDGFFPKDAALKLRAETLKLVERGQLQEANDHAVGASGQKYTDITARGDRIMWLHAGQPPADTAPFSSLMVSFQELQDDLHEIMRLKQRSAEYQLAFYPGNGAGYAKHRDAFPDDGAEEVQRRVTAIAYCNDWEKEHGGVLRVWPPQKSTGLAASRRSRSPTGSEAGTSYSEFSDTSSIRWGAGSVTSSMYAEVTSQHEHEVASIDGVSVAESEFDRLGLEWVEVDGEMVLEVAPVAGRLVLMLSGAVDHAVQPCLTDRVAVTSWCQ